MIGYLVKQNIDKQGKEESKEMIKIKIEINGQMFLATLDDTPTSQALLEKLPMVLRYGARRIDLS